MANLNYGANFEPTTRTPPTQQQFQASLNRTNAPPQQQQQGPSVYDYLFPQIQAQQGYNQSLVGLENTGLGQQVGFLGLNQQQQSQYLQQQLQNQLAQYGLEGQRYGLQLGSLGQQQTEAQQRYNLQNQVLGERGKEAYQGTKESLNDLIGQLTAGGALQTQGGREQSRRLYEQLAYTNTGLGFQRTANQQALQSALQNIQRGRQEVGLGQKGLTLQEQAAQQREGYALQNLGIQTGSQLSSLENQMLQNTLGLYNPQSFANYYQQLFGANVSG